LLPSLVRSGYRNPFDLAMTLSERLVCVRYIYAKSVRQSFLSDTSATKSVRQSFLSDTSALNLSDTIDGSMTFLEYEVPGYSEYMVHRYHIVLGSMVTMGTWCVGVMGTKSLGTMDTWWLSLNHVLVRQTFTPNNCTQTLSMVLTKFGSLSLI